MSLPYPNVIALTIGSVLASSSHAAGAEIVIRTPNIPKNRPTDVTLYAVTYDTRTLQRTHRTLAQASTNDGIARFEDVPAGITLAATAWNDGECLAGEWEVPELVAPFPITFDLGPEVQERAVDDIAVEFEMRTGGGKRLPVGRRVDFAWAEDGSDEVSIARTRVDRHGKCSLYFSESYRGHAITLLAKTTHEGRTFFAEGDLVVGDARRFGVTFEGPARTLCGSITRFNGNCGRRLKVKLMEGTGIAARDAVCAAMLARSKSIKREKSYSLPIPPGVQAIECSVELELFGERWTISKTVREFDRPVEIAADIVIVMFGSLDLPPEIRVSDCAIEARGYFGEPEHVEREDPELSTRTFIRDDGRFFIVSCFRWLVVDVRCPRLGYDRRFIVEREWTAPGDWYPIPQLSHLLVR